MDAIPPGLERIKKKSGDEILCRFDIQLLKVIMPTRGIKHDIGAKSHRRVITIYFNGQLMPDTQPCLLALGDFDKMIPHPPETNDRIN